MFAGESGGDLGDAIHAISRIFGGQDVYPRSVRRRICFEVAGSGGAAQVLKPQPVGEDLLAASSILSFHLIGKRS